MANKRKLSDTAEFKIQRKKRKKGMTGVQKFFIGLCLVISILLVLVLGVFTYFKYIHRPDSDIGTVPQPVTPVSPENNTESIGLPDLNRNRYNFLVVGCDRKAWLSDVIMLVSYDTKDNSLSIMQIPRDTYVTVGNTLQLDENGKISSANFDGKGDDSACKINAVLSHGGKLAEHELRRLKSEGASLDKAKLENFCKDSFLAITPKELTTYIQEPSVSSRNNFEYKKKMTFGIEYLATLLHHNFGMPIDFYVQINLDGFVNIVNAIGGVDVYVQQDMHYDDPYQDLHIHINKGQQHLDGKKAEGFIRFRYGYAGADIARIDAQKIFMTAFIKKVLSLEGIMNMDALIKQISKEITTNISVSDAMFFATNALDLDMSKVTMLTLPGGASYKDGISYFFVDKKTMMDNVNTYLNKYTAPLGEEYFYAVDIGSGNTSTPPLTAEQITDKQPDLGFITPHKPAPAEPTPVETPEDTVKDDIEHPDKSEEQESDETDDEKKNQDVETDEKKPLDNEPSTDKHNPSQNEDTKPITPDTENGKKDENADEKNDEPSDKQKNPDKTKDETPSDTEKFDKPDNKEDTEQGTPNADKTKSPDEPKPEPEKQTPSPDEKPAPDNTDTENKPAKEPPTEKKPLPIESVDTSVPGGSAT